MVERDLFKWRHFEKRSSHTAHRTMRGIETMHMLRKGQVESIAQGDIAAQVKFFTQIFDQAA